MCECECECALLWQHEKLATSQCRWFLFLVLTVSVADFLNVRGYLHRSSLIKIYIYMEEVKFLISNPVNTLLREFMGLVIGIILTIFFCKLFHIFSYFFTV